MILLPPHFHYLWLPLIKFQRSTHMALSQSTAHEEEYLAHTICLFIPAEGFIFVVTMNSSIFVFPYLSQECLIIRQAQVKSNSTLCVNGSKGYEDISSVKYQAKATVLFVLLTIMFFGGILAMLSNSLVLFFGITRRNLFPPEILSLAVTDFLTGLLGTPIVMAIYYFSELVDPGLFK